MSLLNKIDKGIDDVFAFDVGKLAEDMAKRLAGSSFAYSFLNHLPYDIRESISERYGIPLEKVHSYAARNWFMIENLAMAVGTYAISVVVDDETARSASYYTSLILWADSGIKFILEGECENVLQPKYAPKEKDTLEERREKNRQRIALRGNVALEALAALKI